MNVMSFVALTDGPNSDVIGNMVDYPGILAHNSWSDDSVIDALYFVRKLKIEKSTEGLANLGRIHI